MLAMSVKLLLKILIQEWLKISQLSFLSFSCGLLFLIICNHEGFFGLNRSNFWVLRWLFFVIMIQTVEIFLRKPGRIQVSNFLSRQFNSWNSARRMKILSPFQLRRHLTALRRGTYSTPLAFFINFSVTSITFLNRNSPIISESQVLFVCLFPLFFTLGERNFFWGGSHPRFV